MTSAELQYEPRLSGSLCRHFPEQEVGRPDPVARRLHTRHQSRKDQRMRPMIAILIAFAVATALGDDERRDRSPTGAYQH